MHLSGGQLYCRILEAHLRLSQKHPDVNRETTEQYRLHTNGISALLDYRSSRLGYATSKRSSQHHDDQLQSDALDFLQIVTTYA
jgi:hypothetical protein